MDESKPIWMSSTFWSVLIAIVATLVPTLGLTESAISELTAHCVAIVAGVVAIWRRVKATKLIG